jgi:hypothetical protein
VQVKISTKVSDGWTFELYPAPKPNLKMLAISALPIFERVRLTIFDVTLEEFRTLSCLPIWEDGANRKPHAEAAAR